MTRAPKHAFSLIEIMVSVGLLGVIIVGLLAMFYQTQRAFRIGMTQVDVLEAGRATMEMVARDLQELSVSGDPEYVNFEAGPPQGYAPLVLDLGGGFTGNSKLQNVTFIRKVNDEWIGEAYQVSNSMAHVGTLYRMVKTGGSRDLSNVLYWVRTAAIDNKLDTNFMRVADGIIHFSVQPFDSKGLAITNSDPDAGIFLQPDGIPIAYRFTNAAPAYLDFELAVLEPKALEQFRVRASDPVKSEAYLEKQAGRIHFFKRRIPIRHAPQYFSVTNVP